MITDKRITIAYYFCVCHHLAAFSINDPHFFFFFEIESADDFFFFTTVSIKLMKQFDPV